MSAVIKKSPLYGATDLAGHPNILRLSAVSAYEITRLMKQHSLRVYTPGLEYIFATRADLDYVNAFTSALQIRLKNSA